MLIEHCSTSWERRQLFNSIYLIIQLLNEVRSSFILSKNFWMSRWWEGLQITNKHLCIRSSDVLAMFTKYFLLWSAMKTNSQSLKIRAHWTRLFSSLRVVNSRSSSEYFNNTKKFVVENLHNDRFWLCVQSCSLRTQNSFFSSHFHSARAGSSGFPSRFIVFV